MDVTSTSITISWLQSSIPNGIVFIYEIRLFGVDSVNPVSSEFFGYVILNTTETMIALLNLVPFSNYNVQVRGKTNSGFGAYSHGSNINTLEDSKFQCIYNSVSIL